MIPEPHPVRCQSALRDRYDLPAGPSDRGGRPWPGAGFGGRRRL